MRNWKKLGDAASAITDRLFEKRARFKELTPKFFDLCREAIDGGIDPSVLIVSIAATLSYCVAQIDPAHDDAVACKLNDRLPEIMGRAIEARKAGEAPLQ